MKKLLGTILALLSIGQLSAQVGKATINVKVIGNTSSGVNLYVQKDGAAKSLGFQRPDKDGNCTFTVDEKKEGIYFFSRAGVKSVDYKYVLYLKTSEKKQVDLYYRQLSVDYDSCAIKQANPETRVLQAWLDQIQGYGLEVHRDFPGTYAKLNTLEKEAKVFIAKNKTKNSYFNTRLAAKIETDLNYLRAANFFHFNTRMAAKYDSTATAADFYKPLFNQAIVSNPDLLQSEHGQDLLNYVFAFWTFNKTKTGTGLGMVPFSQYVPLITNNEVKAAYILHKMPYIKRYEDFLEQVEPYKAVLSSEEQKAAYQKAYESLYLFAKGTPGYNFSLPDVNDKIHTLASLKGKVVILDIWAMWCAPCLAEKPVMEKIAEEYKGRNDIIFVGVSVDGIGKKEPWKGFVKKKGFTSLELRAEPNEDISKYYKVEGIPRFLIFDKEGRIVTVDAPRPSTPGFKKIIDQALAIK